MAESSSSQNHEENELTMCDVLQEEQELEDDARAVLGGSDDTNCSYNKGYVSRQALYACITCSENTEHGGVCLACSYKCHDGHNIIELYTKRNFRCDCGNTKFPGKPCSLKPDKDLLNNLNKYNQNFKGLYCSCNRPYPDPEDDIPDEMIQCIICEDWYHGRHIGIKVPDDYFEMICSNCMDSHKFLYSYLNKFQYINVYEDAGDEGRNQQKNKVSSIKMEEASNIPSAKIKTETSLKNPTSNGVIKSEDISDISTTTMKETSPEQMKNVVTKDTTTSIKSELLEECSYKAIITKADGILSGPAFWPENWRKELCRCMSCMQMYEELSCTYLIDQEDTILAYEERGKSFSESQYDKGLSALGQMDRVKQMEAVRGYTNMKEQLTEYLKTFAENKKTVSEDDIKEFFERISKRRKLNNGVPHFCR